MKNKVAVVIPCFRVKNHVLSVIENIGNEVSLIFVVDDCCPENSGDYIEKNATDSRVIVLRNTNNLGVGGAVIRGYQEAIKAGADIIVKVDGDGQMDPKLIPVFIAPVITGQADYTKGNRFYNLESVKTMPKVRVFGNAVLSFITKFSTGYWNLFDPTNGYTAIHANVCKQMPLSKISKRYFFESDILFRLNTIRACVMDIPMEAKYGQEVSGIKIKLIIGDFLFKHIRNFLKRLFYNYYLRDMSLASVELPLGVILLLFGSVFGLYHWVKAAGENTITSAGTVMLSAMPIIIGIQLILAFLGHDMASVPKNPLHTRIK